jgi:hypothetical protein
MVGGMTGGAEFMQTGDVLAANPQVFNAMLKSLRPHLATTAKINRRLPD